jgi:pyruvate dehydrogenase E1 component
MFGGGEDIFYYLTLYNENYPMPAFPAERPGIEQGVLDGLYEWAEAPDAPLSATILFSGTASVAATEAQRVLIEEYNVGASLWSATSYKRLREQALSVERLNRLSPSGPQHEPLVTTLLRASAGPIVAVTDFVRAVPDQVSRWAPRRWTSLGTDGFGWSDTREALRTFFEVDAAHIVVAVLSSLAEDGSIGREVVDSAIERFGIDVKAEAPWTP